MKSPERILVTRTDRIGDVVLSIPVIINLRKQFPQSYIAAIVRPYTRELLEGVSFLDEVIVYDKYNTHRGILPSIFFCFLIKKKKFDLALILHPTNRMHLITFFAGIPQRIGWNKKLGFLLTDRLPHTKQKGEKHELEYNLDILRRLNIPIRTKEIILPEKEEMSLWVENFFLQNKLKTGQLIIGLGIGASCPSKIWPPEYFAELAKMFKNELKAKILVVANKKEEELTKNFKERFGEDFIDLTGRLNISRIISLFKRLSLFVGNDSGLIHISSALKIPVVAIFGRADPGLSPQRWKPLGPYSVYIHKNLGCKPCLAHNCEKNFLCLKRITPQEVYKLSLSLIHKTCS